MALEHQIMVGDCIYGFKFPIAASGGDPGFCNEGVVDTSFYIRRINTQKKKKFGITYKTIETVSHTELAFRWLPWVSGKINYAQCGGKDVLSGMFTGCWMVRYQEGGFRVGHVATQTDAGDCKGVWRAHKALGTVSNVSEFRPDLGLPGALNLGLITATGDLYKIQMGSEKIVPIENPWRTVDEWMDPDLGKQTDRSIATMMANLEEVSAQQVFGGFNYRILKIEGPLPSEVFPDA